MSTATMLFLNDASNATNKRTTPTPSVFIKWGEGSEAGVPDIAIHP
jgi:hypothetical protein